MLNPILVLIICCNFIACDLDLLLLHTNDMHSRFEQTDIYGAPCSETLAKQNQCYGGFARLKRAVDDFRQEAANQNIPSLFLNAGDTFQGTPYYTILKNEILPRTIDMLDIDVMCLGNHEFDENVEFLSYFLQNTTTPVVTANLNATSGTKLLFPNLMPSVVLEIDNKKLAIIGYLTPNTKDMSYSDGIVFSDEIASVEKEARRLKEDENVHTIIALGHSGIQKDIEIAQRVPHVSLIVAGHSHTFLYTPKDKVPSIELAEGEYPYMVTQKSGRNVPIVHAFCNTKYLGKLRVKFDNNGNVISAYGNPVLLDSSFPQDQTMLNLINEYKVKIENVTSAVVGRTSVFLAKKPALNEMESNFGNLIADAYVNFVARRHPDWSSGWTDASVAMLQRGNIRTNIDHEKERGKITYGDILTSIPFKNTLYKVKLQGTVLMKALEHGASTSRHFLQVSETAVEKVKSVFIRCANCSVPAYSKLNVQRVYTIIISNYLLQGGDGFYMFKNENYGIQLIDTTDVEAVVEYIKMRQVIYPGIDGRITVKLTN